MYELKKEHVMVFTSNFVGTGPSSYEKRIYQAAVSQRLRNNAVGPQIQAPARKPAVLMLSSKANPLEAWSGPEGSRNLRFPDFVTTAQDSGKVVSLTHRPPLPPGNDPGTHFC